APALRARADASASQGVIFPREPKPVEPRQLATVVTTSVTYLPPGRASLQAKRIFATACSLSEIRGYAGIMKRQAATSLILAALVLAGCGGGKGEVGPTNTASGNGNPGGATPPAQNDPATALFQPLQGVLPYPTDVYFLGSTDGTLNIQPANALMP